MQRMYSRISYARNDEIDNIIKGKILNSEVASKGLRRIICRYQQFVYNSTEHSPELIVKFAQCIRLEQDLLLNKNEYPSKDIFISVIKKSVENLLTINDLIDYIEELSFQDYAKLVESLENFYNR